MAPVMESGATGFSIPSYRTVGITGQFSIGDGQRMRRAGIHAELALPGAGQRNVGLVAEHEVQIFGLAHESAIGLGLQ